MSPSGIGEAKPCLFPLTERKEPNMNRTEKPIMERLAYAKDAVMSCLKCEATSVDFHGLAYWASEVERLRKEIKEQL